MCVFDVLPATVGHFVCKIADTQLVYDFSALNRGPNPVHVIFSSFFFNIPLYARIGNLQPFAHIHKSWTVLVCNVVLGLNVEFRSMSSVDSDYKHTHTHTHKHLYTHWHKFRIVTFYGFSFFTKWIFGAKGGFPWLNKTVKIKMVTTAHGR